VSCVFLSDRHTNAPEVSTQLTAWNGLQMAQYPVPNQKLLEVGRIKFPQPGGVSVTDTLSCYIPCLITDQKNKTAIFIAMKASNLANKWNSTVTRQCVTHSSHGLRNNFSASYWRHFSCYQNLFSKKTYPTILTYFDYYFTFRRQGSDTVYGRVAPLKKNTVRLYYKENTALQHTTVSFNGHL
jgi:hypothetical protein